MKISVVPAEDFDELAALEVAGQLAAKPDSVLGTATGQTTVGVHEALVRRHRAETADFAQAAIFQIDEYVGVSIDNPLSCRRRIEAQLSRRVNIREECVFFPAAGSVREVEAVCRRYEEAIAAEGGLDLQILGIGTNGHVGFNEPGTSFGTLTHVVPISTANAHVRPAGEPLPTHGITMGLRTIMNARHVLLLAKGGDKAAILRTALHGPVTKEVPASVLQLHPALTVILDSGAGSEL
jgi:glucosamine-6-phosphate deaminase